MRPDPSFCGSVDGEQAGQPDLATPIGYEYIDPPLFTHAEDSSCPSGRQCRYSDVAAFELYNVPYWPGHIARTLGGQITITDIASIASDIWIAGHGITVVKEGSTTGWTSGIVQNYGCAAAPQYELIGGVQYDTGRTMLCQTYASYDSQAGDSGSLVFWDCCAISSQRNPMCITGINWGRGTSAVYSSYQFVKAELSAAFGVSTINVME